MHAFLFRPGLGRQVFLAVLATAALAVALVLGLSRWSFERGFLGYLNEQALERMDFVVPRLARAYAEHGSWDFLRGQDPSRWFRLLRPVPGEDLPADAARRPPRPLPSDLSGAALRLTLLDAQQQWVAGFRELEALPQRRAVVVAGQTVGWLVLAPFQSASDGGERRFAQGLSKAALGAALLSLVLAALIAGWLTRRVLAPVRDVAAATHRLAAGLPGTRVAAAAGRGDEIGQLARDFNQLALTLERSTELRREFVADVSHELRTPLAVLRGELEAMEDGIRPLDRPGIVALQGEVRRLGQLLDDLDQLARSDVGALSYRRAPTDLAALLHEAAARWQRPIAEAGLRLDLDLPPGPLQLQADADRLRQLLDNLLRNSQAYTAAPGRLQLRVRADGRCWRLTLDDSAPGVPAEALPRLFERFFRVEGSRSRLGGGAGLGLAIARNIVLAHGGQILAEASPLGGLRLRVDLPADPPPASA